MLTFKAFIAAASLALAGFSGAIASAAPQVTSATKSFSKSFTGELEQVVASHHGDMAVFCKNLDTGESFEVNADQPFPTASTIKTAVMCTAMDLLVSGNGPFKSYYDTKVYDASTSTGGSGIIQNYMDGRKVELKELIHLMMTVSDNIGTNMLVEWVGLDKINQWLEKHGFEQTRMFATIGGRLVYDENGRKDWGLGRTTAREMARLMEMIATGKAGTTSSTDEMLRVLGHQYFDGCIAAEVPPMTYVGSKSGALNRQRADNAIVASPGGTYVLSVYTNNNEDTHWDSTNEAEANIRKVSKLVWHHFNPKSKWQRPEGTEKF